MYVSYKVYDPGNIFETDMMFLSLPQCSGTPEQSCLPQLCSLSRVSLALERVLSETRLLWTGAPVDMMSCMYVCVQHLLSHRMAHRILHFMHAKPVRPDLTIQIAAQPL